MFSYQARLLSAAANNGSATGVRGKLDDVKKVKGVNIFPPAIEETPAGVETLTHDWEAVIERVKEVDRMTVRAEVNPDVDKARWPSIREEVEKALAASLLIRCPVELVEALLTSLLDCGLPFVESNAAGALPFVQDCLDAFEAAETDARGA